MSSLFANSIRVLNAGLKSIGGETVTYRRGNDSIDGLTAIPVQTRHDELLANDPASITAREQDWIVLADDLAISGQYITPKRGDEIEWTDARGVRRTFRVLPRLGDRCYRHTDQSKLQLRVYTVEQIPSGE